MWPLREVDEAGVVCLAAETGAGRVLARLLWLRGVRTADEARRWLSPAVEHLHPAELLPDYATARDRLLTAIRNREPVLVWGHDDLDGITGVAVLVRVLDGLRARTGVHIPARGAEKHGLALDRALDFARQGFRLIVTVDCGITNGPEVAALAEHGVDVIVTDHHEQSGDLPPAVACVDPKRPGSSYPYRGLAGVGVALKLMMGICRDVVGLSPAEFLSAESDLVALAVLGTVADRVPLTGENRTLVSLGLPALERCRLPAVRALLGRLGYAGRLTPFKMVPRLLPLFAAAEGNEGVRRLLDPDPAGAERWADELEARAEEWRAEAERSAEIAEREAVVGDGVVLVRSRELSLRALGFCAARLKQRYNLPVLVMGWRGDAWVGECRGVEGMNLVELLGAGRELLLDYGGHKLAGGFTVRDELAGEFSRRVEEYAHRYLAQGLRPEPGLEADVELALGEFDRELCRLAPFGEGNRPPVLVSEPCRVAETPRGWVPENRPDLALVPARRGMVPHSGRMRLLYSCDDEANLAVLDSRPVAGDA
ncbi:DHH family phosphoesterase [candidate division WOR-3 bacterium]|nr:DHH family phosphoesterase [candidate division WOR-3 bacterium]